MGRDAEAGGKPGFGEDLGGSPWARRRPWSRSTISSANRAASVRLCMMATTSAPDAAWARENVQHHQFVARIEGRDRLVAPGAPAPRVASARASSTRARSPPDSSVAGRLSKPRKADARRWRPRPPAVPPAVQRVRLLAMGQAAERHDARHRHRPGDRAALRQIGDGLRPLTTRAYASDGRAVRASPRRASRLEEAREASQQGRLAGAVGSHHDREAAGVDSARSTPAQRLAAAERTARSLCDEAASCRASPQARPCAGR